MDAIHVSSDSQSFAHKNSGAKYTPFGCNYFDPATGWAPHIWQRYSHERTLRHFEQMKELGVNTVRVFLSIQSFMKKNGLVEESAMEKACKMLEAAKRTGIRIEFSGPDHWEGIPDWCTPLFDNEPNAYFLHPEFVERLAAFWQDFAKRLRSDPALFSYDLRNEPWLKWDSPLVRQLWGGAVPEEDYGGLDGSGLADFFEFREQLTRQWTAKMAGAIRSSDPEHMITIGFHQLSLPHDADLRFTMPGFHAKPLSPLLDYVALHWYPYSREEHVQPTSFDDPLELNIQMIRSALRNAYAGKPQVIEEFGWYGGGEVYSWGRNLPFVSEELQAHWCGMIVEKTQDLSAGWLCWGYADVPDAMDATRRSGLVDENGRVKEWGRTFRKLAGTTGS